MALKRRQVAALRSKYLDDRSVDRGYNSVDNQNLKNPNFKDSSDKGAICQNGFKNPTLNTVSANQTTKTTYFTGLEQPPINLND